VLDHHRDTGSFRTKAVTLCDVLLHEFVVLARLERNATFFGLVVGIQVEKVTTASLIKSSTVWI
jgi:hypothetical protein